MAQNSNGQSLRALQLEELKILQQFKQICDKHQLKFYMTAGTLLGAVRHSGFIPWDDDIDVVMPREDFEKLRKIMSQDTPPGYFYQDGYTDDSYPFFFAKLRKNGTQVAEPTLEGVPMHTGIYIDIFPLDICPQSKSIAILFFKSIELLTCGLLAQNNPKFTCGYVKWYMRLLHSVCRRMPRLVLLKSRDGVRSIVSRWCKQSRLCTVGGAHGYPYETYQAEWFRTIDTVSFEGNLLPAPMGWDALLSNMYGDYMCPPPKGKREGHFDAVVLSR